MTVRWLPLIPPNGQSLVPCTRCAQCCTYVAIEVEEPNSLKNATDILWFLYHERVSVLMERRDRWTLLFDARCKNLGDDLLCKIYSWRPHICRSYEQGTCEVNARGNARTFRAPEEFLEYMKQKRPRTYRLLEKRFMAPSNGAAAAVSPKPATSRKPRQTQGRAS